MPIKKMIKVATLLLFCAHLGFSQTISLDSCQTAAELNWPLFEQYELLEQAKQYSLENVKKNYYPKISVLGIGGVITGLPSIGDASNTNAQFVGLVQLNQTIYDGGITKNQKAITQLNYAKQQAELKQKMLQVKERVQDLYFGTLLIGEKIKVLESFKSVLDEREKQIQIAVLNGLVLASDQSEIKIAKIKNAQQIQNLRAKQQEFVNLIQLITQIDLQADQLIHPSKVLFSATSVYQRPEYQVLDYQKELLETEKNMQSSFLLPKIGLMGIAVGFEPQLGLGPAETGGIALAGLSLAWSIDPLYANKARKSLIETQQMMLEKQRASITQNLDFSSQSLALQIENYNTEIKSAEEILKLQEDIAKTYANKYEQGLINLSDYFAKTAALNTARIEVKSLILSQQQAIYLYNLNTGNSHD